MYRCCVCLPAESRVRPPSYARQSKIGEQQMKLILRSILALAIAGSPLLPGQEPQEEKPKPEEKKESPKPKPENKPKQELAPEDQAKPKQVPKPKSPGRYVWGQGYFTERHCAPRREQAHNTRCGHRPTDESRQHSRNGRLCLHSRTDTHKIPVQRRVLAGVPLGFTPVLPPES